jgi:DNA polymerase-3 subunit gamma/tau
VAEAQTAEAETPKGSVRGAEASVSAPKTPKLKKATPQEMELPEAKAVESSVSAHAVVDVEKLWPSLVEAVRKERPLISMWLEGGVLAEVSGGVARLEFPKEQSLSAEYLLQANNRSFLEELLQRQVGNRVSLHAELCESVVLRPVAQPPPPEKEVQKDPMEEFKNDPLIRKALDIFKARLEVVS